jgi:hypothetical protein
MPIAIKPLYVKLAVADRDRLDKLAADSGAAAGHPVTVSDVVRQLVRDASKNGVPVRIRPEGAT